MQHPIYVTPAGRASHSAAAASVARQVEARSVSLAPLGWPPLTPPPPPGGNDDDRERKQ